MSTLIEWMRYFQKINISPQNATMNPLKYNQCENRLWSRKYGSNTKYLPTHTHSKHNLHVHNFHHKVSNSLEAQQTDAQQHMMLIIACRLILHKIECITANCYQWCAIAAKVLNDSTNRCWNVKELRIIMIQSGYTYKWYEWMDWLLRKKEYLCWAMRVRAMLYDKVIFWKYMLHKVSRSIKL